MRIQILIQILLLLLIISACETVIDIDVESKENNFIINSLITDDSIMKVNVSRNINITDRANYIPITNASIKVFENETLLQELTNNQDGFYVSDFIPEKGKKYTIEVSASGFPTAKATSEVPNKTPIISLETNNINDYSLNCKVKFKDNDNEQNYYMFSACNTGCEYYTDYISETEMIDTSYTYEYCYFDTEDIIVEEWIYFDEQEFIIFSDELLQGKEHTLPIIMDYYISENDTLTLTCKLYSITESYYEYLKTFARHQEAVDNPFVEPVQVYNNIEEGIGVFAGFSVSSDSVFIYSGGMEK